MATHLSSLFFCLTTFLIIYMIDQIPIQFQSLLESIRRQKEEPKKSTEKNPLSTFDINRIAKKEAAGDRFKISNIISSRIINAKKGSPLVVDINEDDFTPGLNEAAKKNRDYILGGKFNDKEQEITVIRPQASTAVQSVEYDPKTNTAWLTFVGGKKAYAYDVTPQELEQFARAGSKGRWVNRVWKIHNRKGGF